MVVGNETDGVSVATPTEADLVMQIPMSGAVESLNVGVAAGISIYELRTKTILDMLTERIRDTLGRNLSWVPSWCCRPSTANCSMHQASTAPRLC